MQRKELSLEIRSTHLTCYTVAYEKKIFLTGNSNVENIFLGFDYNILCYLA
jgi:hypothetical protein